MLEQRQREYIELCKSDSEDDNPDNEEVTNNGILENTMPKDNLITENVKNSESNCAKEMIIHNDILNNTVEKETINSDLEEKDQNNTINIDQIVTSENTEEKQVIDSEMSETSLLQYSTENDVDTNTSLNETPKNIKHTNTEDESQVMTLHYESEVNSFLEKKHVTEESLTLEETSKSRENSDDEFMDNDFNFDEISKIIDEAELNGKSFINCVMLSGASHFICFVTRAKK